MSDRLEALTKEYLALAAKLRRGGGAERAKKMHAKGQLTRYSYDNLDRLIELAYADGETLRYTYDSLSHLTSMADQL